MLSTAGKQAVPHGSTATGAAASAPLALPGAGMRSKGAELVRRRRDSHLGCVAARHHRTSGLAT